MQTADENVADSSSEVDEDLEEELVDTSSFCLAAHSGMVAKFFGFLANVRAFC